MSTKNASSQSSIFSFFQPVNQQNDSQKNIPFKLTSAKNPLSFNKFLEDLVKKYVEKNGGNVGNEVKQSKGKININDKNQKEKKKCC